MYAAIYTVWKTWWHFDFDFDNNFANLDQLLPISLLNSETKLKLKLARPLKSVAGLPCETAYRFAALAY